MSLSFSTPLGALVAVAVVAPLLAFARGRRAAARVRRALRLPAGGPRLAPAIAICVLVALVAVAAAQPVIDRTKPLHERQDAAALFVVDTSRSMLASSGPHGLTRFQRAQRAALALRASLAQVPAGVASLSDRVLPEVFPTTDPRVFTTVVEHAIGIDQPPPLLAYTERATTYDALAAVPQLGYFAPSAEHRLLVVLTDGESQPLTGKLDRAFAARPRVRTIYVQLWGADERIYDTGLAERGGHVQVTHAGGAIQVKAEGGYRPDPSARATLEQVARETNGAVFTESQLGAAERAAARFLGAGPTHVVHEGSRFELMPWVTLAGFLPLGFLLWRRNV